jgi:hypothetical protein
LHDSGISQLEILDHGGLIHLLGGTLHPHHRVEFFHPPREVEYSTFRVEIQDHHFKWNFPPFSVTVQARGLHVTMYADDVQYYDFYQPQLTALLGTRLAECGKATNLLMGNQPAVTPHQVADVVGNFESAS